jgi:tetratricopeptide (TPR) repeat protein
VTTLIMVILLAAAPAAPESATAPRDTVSVSAPAPLLVPGHGATADTTARRRAEHAKEQYQLGRTLERNGAHASAIAAYRTATRLDPRIADANYRMGMLFLSVDQQEQAVRCFQAELKYHSGNADAARELGLALARLGKSDQAVTGLERLVRRRPNDGDAWQALGFAYLSANRQRAAEIALRRAIVLPPNRADKHRDLAVVLTTRGNLKEARQEYGRAIALAPNDPTPWINLGNLERRANNPEKALANYREAEKRDSTFGLAFQGEIEALTDLRRDQEAGEVYRRWLRARPDDSGARLAAIRFYDRMGRKDVALEIARDGVRLKPKSAEAHLMLGMALESAGQTRAALDEMRRAEELFPEGKGRDRARALIEALRSGAADSLHDLFAADSVAHAEAHR